MAGRAADILKMVLVGLSWSSQHLKTRLPKSGFHGDDRTNLNFLRNISVNTILKLQFCLCGKHLNNILALFIPFVQLDIFMVVQSFFMD